MIWQAHNRYQLSFPYRAVVFPPARMTLASVMQATQPARARSRIRVSGIWFLSNDRGSDIILIPCNGMQPHLYVLLVDLGQSTQAKVGALGDFIFAPGTYLYVGSARRNAKQRVQRHFAKTKKIRWHIDYLTSTAAVRSMGALTVRHPTLTECELNGVIGALRGVTAPIPHFGASDCRAGCPAHLWYSVKPMTQHRLSRAIHRSGRASAATLFWQV